MNNSTENKIEARFTPVIMNVITFEQALLFFLNEHDDNDAQKRVFKNYGWMNEDGMFQRLPSLFEKVLNKYLDGSFSNCCGQSVEVNHNDIYSGVCESCGEHCAVVWK